jgi:tetratricopeptide (TPR) repeat protein
MLIISPLYRNINVMFCHQCGKPLTLGFEKYCPFCGASPLQQKEEEPLVERDSRSVSITDTKGDVFGAGVSGSGHFIGKELAYTIQGNVIYLHISGGVSNEVLQTLQKIVTVPTQVESTISIGGKEAVVEAKQQIGQVLEEVDKISKKEGIKIEEIRAGDLKISTKELSVNEIMLKGNEHYCKKEYSEAIKWYDKAIELDPKYADAWYNKGNALNSLGKYEEAIENFDKALKIDPNYASAWNNKGYAIDKLGKYQEAIEHYNKAIELDPNIVSAWSNKGYTLTILENYDEAIKCYNKAIELNPVNAVSYNKMKDSILEKLEKARERTGL